MHILAAANILIQQIGQERLPYGAVILFGLNEAVQYAVCGNGKTMHRLLQCQELPVILAGLERIYAVRRFSIVPFGDQGDGAVVEKGHHAAVTDVSDMEFLAIVYCQGQGGVEAEGELVPFCGLRFDGIPCQAERLADHFQHLLISGQLVAGQDGLTVRQCGIYSRPGTLVGQYAASQTIRNGRDQIVVLLGQNDPQAVGILAGGPVGDVAGTLLGKAAAEYLGAVIDTACGIGGKEELGTGAAGFRIHGGSFGGQIWVQFFHLSSPH